MVQTGQHVTKNLGEKLRFGRGTGAPGAIILEGWPCSVDLVAPFALPTLEGTAGQVDDSEPQKDDDDEHPRGACELP
jgi:hypothetical protein